MNNLLLFFCLIVFYLPYLGIHYLGIDLPKFIPIEAFIQSLASSCLCIILGFIGALGALNFNKNSRLIKFIQLSPQAFPPLLIGIMLLFISNKSSSLGGVILAHIILNSGLSCFLIIQSLSDINNQEFSLQSIGISPVKARALAIWNQFKTQFIYIFLILFMIHINSFSIPYLLNPYGNLSFETIMFNEYSETGKSSSATFFLILNLLITLIMSQLKPGHIQSQDHYFSEIRVKFGLLYLFIPLASILFLASSSFLMFFQLGTSMSFFLENLHSIKSAAFNTLFLLLFVNLLFLICLCVCFVNLSITSFKVKFLEFYIPLPLIFYSVIYWKNLNLYPYLFLSLFLCTLYFSFLYRMFFTPRIDSLNKIFLSYRHLGVSKFKVSLLFFKNLKIYILQSCSLLSLWVLGDFGLSQLILGHGGNTLGLLAYSWSKQYKFSESYILIIFSSIIIISFFIFVIKLIEPKALNNDF